MTRRAGREEAEAAPERLAAGWPAAWPILLFAGIAVLLLVVYRHALQGEFVSDDVGYIVTNPYTSALSRENVLAILDPWGHAKLYTANYAPVHLLAHALEQQIFADRVLGYHLVNVAIHALNCVLLVALLLASRAPPGAALLGGLLFAVHPANVEAVAWISQLKTNGSLALALGALLAMSRRRALAAALFGIGLLTKASAAFALPMAAGLVWARRGSRRDWAWLGIWTLLLALYAVPEFSSFGHIGSVEEPAYADPWLHARTIAAVGARYLVMAATSYGVSAFQEPEPATSAFDPWWLAALPAGALLAWRLVSGLRRRSEEAAWWLGAAASFAPVSQYFPFLNPIADRYLYFILPGLIGGAVLSGAALGARIGGLPVAVTRGALVAACALAVFFAIHSAERAKLWRNETLLLVDAAAHYPEGGTAHVLRARQAAHAGDAEAAVAALRVAAERGLDRFMVVAGDPGLAPIRHTPEFQALIRAMAGEWIAKARRRGRATQPELRVMAHAHLVRGETDEAERVLERALEAGGPLDSVVRAELNALHNRRSGTPSPEGPGGAQEDESHRAQSP
jgi:hypothetical protein